MQNIKKKETILFGTILDGRVGIKVFFLELPWMECCDKKFFFGFALGGRKVLRNTLFLGTALDGGKVVRKTFFSTLTLINLNPKLKKNQPCPIFIKPWLDKNPKADHPKKIFIQISFQQHKCFH